jgi:hypothetical protein
MRLPPNNRQAFFSPVQAGGKVPSAFLFADLAHRPNLTFPIFGV